MVSKVQSSIVTDRSVCARNLQNTKARIHTHTQITWTHNFSWGQKSLQHFSSGQTHSCLQHVATHPTAWQVGTLQKGLGYFYHMAPQLHSFVCVTRRIQGMLTIWKSLVKKLPSFVKLASPYKSAFLVKFVVSFFDPTHLPLDSCSLVPWLW